uniref:Calcineurin-like phosphoesterase domain-containing protein n=1 Tax=Monodelphis domestica TaxID=13616 RepID=A0A5F8GJU1_MONDO
GTASGIRGTSCGESETGVGVRSLDREDARRQLSFRSVTDFTAQIIDEEWTEEAVLIIVKRLTDLLLLVFPDTTVYATLGNHDFYPKDQLPAKSNVIYSYIADLWRPWLDYKSISQFKKGAFYYQNLPGPNSNGQIVVLNTNLYYEKNGAENRLNDPGKQFQWLDTVLSEAFQDGKKVYIIGHMPPGFFEKTRNKAWFRPNFNKRYMEIIKKHYRVIEGQFFGHHHTDSFRMFYDDKGKHHQGGLKLHLLSSSNNFPLKTTGMSLARELPLAGFLLLSCVQLFMTPFGLVLEKMLEWFAIFFLFSHSSLFSR